MCILITNKIKISKITYRQDNLKNTFKYIIQERRYIFQRSARNLLLNAIIDSQKVVRITFELRVNKKYVISINCKKYYSKTKYT